METKKLNSIHLLLKSGLKLLDIKLSKEASIAILNFVLQLDKWRKTYSLIGPATLEEIIIKHVLDSLAIVPYITGPEILDFGSGAGFPGIPLALALPQYHFTLLDSKIKKITFLTHVALTLKISNLTIIQSRIELFQPNHHFNTIVTRATGSINDIIKKTRHLYSPNGQLLAMQGKLSNPSPHIAQLHKLYVPYLKAKRYLACIPITA
jgi:16S rRNA (guanine527-N7)-methyltransferase